VPLANSFVRCRLTAKGFKMLDDSSITEALRILREYAATEPDLRKLCGLTIELNTILDILDSRIDDQQLQTKPLRSPVS
jgi:hypothetical protein